MAPHPIPGRRERGSALVELALGLPLLLLVLFGAADFARVFFSAMQLSNAARAGAQYGSASIVNSALTGPGQAIETTTTGAVNLTGITATAARTCACASDDGATFNASACSATCAGGQHLAVFVTVTAQLTGANAFKTISPFPGIPGSISLSRSATLRVPN